MFKVVFVELEAANISRIHAIKCDKQSLLLLVTASQLIYYFLTNTNNKYLKTLD